MILLYEEAEKIVRDYLKQIPNLSKYSRDKNYDYQSLSLIRNNNPKNKTYTVLVKNILEELSYTNIKIIKKITFLVDLPKKKKP